MPTFPHERMLVVDEIDQSLWQVPHSSLSAWTNHIYIPYNTWKKHMEASSRDVFTFVNADSIAQLHTQIGLKLPEPSAVKTTSGESGETTMLVRSISIMFAPWKDFGASFLWPLSYKNQNQLFARSEELSGPSADNVTQRPRPRQMLGASRVDVKKFAAEMTSSEREFYATISCAPYAHRNCFKHLETYWRSTKMHKEHHPHRVALKHRLRRDVEQRQMQSVRVLLDRSLQNASLGKDVAANAKLGLQTLQSVVLHRQQTQQTQQNQHSRAQPHAGNNSSLRAIVKLKSANNLHDLDNLDNCNGCNSCNKCNSCNSSNSSNSCNSSCNDRNDYHRSNTTRGFPFLELPFDVQCVVLSFVVKNALSNPYTDASICDFFSARLVCHFFDNKCSELANNLVSDARREIANFVLHGAAMRPSRMRSIQSWAYAELACLPVLLLREYQVCELLNDHNETNNYSPCLRLLKARKRTKLTNHVCAARAEPVESLQYDQTSNDHGFRDPCALQGRVRRLQSIIVR